MFLVKKWCFSGKNGGGKCQQIFDQILDFWP